MKNHILRNVLCFAILSVFTMNIGWSQLTCGDHLLKTQFEKKYPSFLEQVEQTFKTASSQASVKSGNVYQIPVVFHVVYNTTAENYSDDLIHDQIAVLNEDFRRLNDDSVDTRPIFEDIAADAQIEFFLAEIDPDGNPTTGITRTQTEKNSFIDLDFAALLVAAAACGITGTDISEEQLACLEEQLGTLDLDLDLVKQSAEGGKDAWDTEHYLNIWSCNLSLEFLGEPMPFLLGFAYPPVGAPNWPEDIFPPKEYDGVVLHYQTVGRNHPDNGALAGLNDAGRTATHEVGHYLGLRHIWGDGDCSADDGINDTPPAAANSQLADASDISCGVNHSKDSCVDDMFPDMVENYMDYYIESCQNMFTDEQADLMRAMLEGPRSELYIGSTATSDVLDFNVDIFPNPTQEFVLIEDKEQNISSASLLNKEGKRIMSLTPNRKNDLSIVSPGIYFVQYQVGKHQVIEQVIKL